MVKLPRNRTPSLLVVGSVSEDRPLTRDDAPKTSVPKAGITGRPGRVRRSRATRPPALPAPENAGKSPAIASSHWPAVPDGEVATGAHGTGPIAAPHSVPEAPRESRWFRPSVVNVKTAYACYLVSLAVPPAALVGLLIAFEGSKSSPAAWLASHYTYQLRTFWMGLALNVIAWTLLFSGVGLLLYPLIAAWVVARAVKGIARVATGEPIEDPHALFV